MRHESGGGLSSQYSVLSTRRPGIWLLVLSVLFAIGCNPVTGSGQRLSLEEMVDGTATPTSTPTALLVLLTPTATPTVQVIELRTATAAATTSPAPVSTPTAAVPSPATPAPNRTRPAGLSLSSPPTGTATPTRASAATSTAAPPASTPATAAAPPPAPTSTPAPTSPPTITSTPTSSPTPTPIGWVRPAGTPQPQPTRTSPVAQATARRTSAAITGRVFFGSSLTTGRVQLEQANGTVIRTVATNPDGVYRFDQVLPGTYRVHALPLPPDSRFVDDAVDTVTLGLVDAYRQLSLARRLDEQSPTHKGRLCISEPLVWNAPAGVAVATYRVSVIPLQAGVREESGPLKSTSYRITSQLNPGKFYQWIVRGYDADGGLIAKTDEGKSDRRFTFTAAVTCAAPTPTP